MVYLYYIIGALLKSIKKSPCVSRTFSLKDLLPTGFRGVFRRLLGYYTRKGYKTLADLPQGARVGIPNDPTNANRALHMLEEQGLVRLNPKAGIRATVLDIIDNVKKLRIIELDSAQLPRSLEDLDAAAINASYAEPAGLTPAKDGIAQERPDGPYANILCVRAEDLSKPWVAKFVQCYHSPEVKAFVEKRFNGGMICAW